MENELVPSVIRLILVLMKSGLAWDRSKTAENTPQDFVEEEKGECDKTKENAGSGSETEMIVSWTQCEVRHHPEEFQQPANYTR
jgi:hypothetical protein